MDVKRLKESYFYAVSLLNILRQSSLMAISSQQIWCPVGNVQPIATGIYLLSWEPLFIETVVSLTPAA